MNEPDQMREACSRSDLWRNLPSTVALGNEFGLIPFGSGGNPSGAALFNAKTSAVWEIFCLAIRKPALRRAAPKALPFHVCWMRSWYLSSPCKAQTQAPKARRENPSFLFGGLSTKMTFNRYVVMNRIQGEFHMCAE